jgi:hypothetical protein
LLILTGFKKGAFSDGKGNLISSDKGQSGYIETWKSLVKEYASDVVETLAVTVFDVSVTRVANIENPT